MVTTDKSTRVMMRVLIELIDFFLVNKLITHFTILRKGNIFFQNHYCLLNEVKK